jgi:predicted HAD superfamily hydrolase
VELKQRAQLLEIELERNLVRPITSVLSKMRSGDLIVSDMYHGANLYREILKKLAPDVLPGAVIVSGSVGLNKASGKLWKRVIADYPDLQTHVGDNPLADVKRARQNGLRASLYHGASLNRFEAALASNGLDGSLMAGVSKSTRLSLIRVDSSPPAVATIEAFSSVFGPLFYAFADWIIRSCENAGINSVYFLARESTRLTMQR